MKVFRYVANVKHLHGNNLQHIEGRVEASNIMQATQFLATDPRYYCVMVMGIETGEQSDVRYLSAEAWNDILANEGSKPFANIEIGKGLKFDITREQFSGKPRIEVGCGDYWIPKTELTEKGWVSLEERV